MKKIIFIMFYVFLAFQSQSQKDCSEIRYYYNFKQKQLFSDSAMMNAKRAPIRYKAGRDINIDIKNFNPLKYEIIVEDASTELFLKDTAKLSSYIITPTIPNLPGGVPLKTDKNGESALRPAPETPCDSLSDALYELNDQKSQIESLIIEYKNLLVTIENINNTFENLKSLDVLSSSNVKSELTNTFISPLNSFLASNGYSTIPVDPKKISSGTLDVIELASYNKEVQTFANLQKLKTSTDKLSNNPSCGNKFLELYKEFQSIYELINNAQTDFNSTRTAHLASFKSTISLYDKIRVYTISNPELVTRAITIDHDLHTIIINTKTQENPPILYDNIHVQPCKAIKIDVAPGFFFSNLSDDSFFKYSMDSIHHKNYLVDGVLRDTLVQESFTAIYKKKNANLSFGGMIYLQVHTQTSTNRNYGGFLGFGAMFNDQARWAGAVGGSFLIGKYQRFNINVGLILSQVDRLSPPYDTNHWYQESIDNIPIYRAWKTGFTTGFSWNM